MNEWCNESTRAWYYTFLSILLNLRPFLSCPTIGSVPLVGHMSFYLLPLVFNAPHPTGKRSNQFSLFNSPSPCFRRREVGSTTRFASSSSGSALVFEGDVHTPTGTLISNQTERIYILSKCIKSRPSISVWELELIVCSLALFNE